MSDDGVIDAAMLEEKQETAAFMEFVTNGELIDWRYWVEQMPQWTPAEAARLINGLDPDLFADLSSPPLPRNNTSKETSGARHAERLAHAQAIVSMTPDEWFAWASEHDLKVQLGMRLALYQKSLKAEAVQSSESGTETLQFYACPTPEPVDSMSGKLPKIAVGRLAIHAAWEIEHVTKRRATDRQVMERLQQWADEGAKPETLLRSERARRSVFWLTTKSVEKEYTLEACQKTLQTWWATRE